MKRLPAAPCDLPDPHAPVPSADAGEGFTVQQVAAFTGLSEHTLRYYERCGLLESIRRTGRRGDRRYSPEDLARVRTLACLKALGMPLEQMRHYFELARLGREAAPEARAMFLAQQEALEARIWQMQEHLGFLRQKLAYWEAVGVGDEAAAAGIQAGIYQRIQESQLGAPGRP